jgi:hypothetical protein
VKYGSSFPIAPRHGSMPSLSRRTDVRPHAPIQGSRRFANGK